MPELAVDRVVVHPLVLLSVVDHFNRIGKVGNQKRVVGVLLGSWQKKILDVSNSFAAVSSDECSEAAVKLLKQQQFGILRGGRFLPDPGL